MEKIQDRELLLKRLKAERSVISKMLENGDLTKAKLLEIFNFPTEFGLVPSISRSSKKTRMYKQIYNSPFLLCDQENLNPSVKEPFESFLNRRFTQELDEANSMLNIDQISVDEYLDIYSDLNFCYYETSEEGEKIREKKRYR